MPLSRRPEARARQLDNLRAGGGRPLSYEHRPALRHGGYAAVAPEREREVMRRLREALTADAPMRSSADDALLSLAARALARLEDVERYHEDFGWRDEGTGEPRPSVELERRLRQELADHLDALGMSPRSRAKLGVDLARGLDAATALSAAREESDPAIRRALLAAAGLIDGDADDDDD
jgi:hypothetical protein